MGGFQDSEMSQLTYTLSMHLELYDIPQPVAEYRFVAEMIGGGRGLKQRLQNAGLQDWRFDFAYPDLKLAIECEGGTWANGRHSRGAGYEGDCRKYNAAILHGWRVLRFTSGMIASGEAVRVIERAIDRSKVRTV